MSCIFCKIVSKEIPAEIIYEDDDLLIFNDINPKAKVHLLIIPKKHIDSLAEISSEDQELMGKIMFQVKIIASDFGLSENGYKLITNIGEDGGQVVFHLHFHLLGGERLKGIV
jgi:histidine triad (HIT) family protein